jgi:hypothetical protein
MHQQPLDIRGAGRSFVILQGTKALPGRYTSAGNATAALRGIERRLAPTITRRCLTCSRPFRSTGPGHRLCNCCRRAT